MLSAKADDDLLQRLERAAVAVASQNPDQGIYEFKRIDLERIVSSLEALQQHLVSDNSVVRCLTVHDGVLHNPLGSGGYTYKHCFVPSLFQYLGLKPSVDHSTVVIHIGAQPNNSPHAGTLVVFALAFLIGREMKRHHRATGMQSNENVVKDLDVQIHLDLVDTAPDDSKTHYRDGITYQKSHRDTKAMQEFLPDYEEIMKSLHEFVNGEVSYKITTQGTLMNMPSIPRIIDTLVADRERLGEELSPDRKVIALRRACPEPGCSYADKHGRKNIYTTAPSGEKTVGFVCPDHGVHTISLSNPSQVAELEFNTPLRNLVRTIAYGEDTLESRKGGTEGQRVHMRVTGMDYAGTYQEQLLWRQLPILRAGLPSPVIVYAPLIVDWAGSKVSKSLYVEKGAYEYLREMGRDYMLSYKVMKERGRDVKVLFQEVESWLKEPERLFRSFSIEYLHGVFEKARLEKAG